MAFNCDTTVVLSVPQLYRLIGREELEVCAEIAPDDVMFDGDRAHYFSVGVSALESVLDAMVATDTHELRTILDLPCGHGRVLRTLRAAFPDACITACDLLRAGVDFCASRFAAMPVYSEEDPGHIPTMQPFDLVWCGSLLTHLDQDRWDGFLRRFGTLVAPHGMVLFTVHGEYVAQRLRQDVSYGLGTQAQRALLASFDQCGFGYQNYPNRRGYGISLAAPAWVYDRVYRNTNLRIVRYMLRRWDNHHDVVVCQVGFRV